MLKLPSQSSSRWRPSSAKFPATESPALGFPATSGPLRVALVGYGYWGRVLAREISADPRFSLVLVVDPLVAQGGGPAGVPAASDGLAELCASARLADDLATLLDDNTIEAAFVATPVATHFELCRMLLASGRHVFCEKPLVRTLAELDELQALAARMGRILFCDYVYLGSPSVRRLLDLRGELGQLRLFQGEVSQFGNFYQNDSALDVLGVHLLSVLAALLGPLDDDELRTAARCAHVESPLGDGRLGASVSLDLGELRALLECDLLSPSKTRRIKVVGTRGSATFSMTDPETTLSWVLYDPSGDPSGAAYEVQAKRSVALDEAHGVAGVLDWFYKAVRSGDGSDSASISRSVTALLEVLEEVLDDMAAPPRLL